MNWREVKFSGGAAAHGSWLIRQGTRDFRSWKEAMMAKYGDSIEDRLSSIYSESEVQAAAVVAMEQESRRLLGASVWEQLEDANWSSNQRKEAGLLPLRRAYKGVKEWSSQELKRAVETITVLMVSRIFGEMVPLPEGIRKQCRSVASTIQALEAAQEASTGKLDDVTSGVAAMEICRAALELSGAAADAGWGAIRAAWTFGELANAGAMVARAAKSWGGDPDEILCSVCQIWVEAASGCSGAEP
jgi:hypothetical protein